MYKLIACDLDETLIGYDRTICQRNIDAVRAARERGAKFVVATGRGYALARTELKELGLYQRAGEYTISFNGGALTENAGERLLRFEGLAFEQANVLYTEALKRDFCVHAYTKDALFIENLTDADRAGISPNIPYETVSWGNLEPLRGTDIAKVIVQREDVAILQALERELSPLVEGVQTSYSSNRFLEYNRAGVDKGAGLLHLAEILGIPREETIAIGDNPNDLAMIRAAGLGCGVANVAQEMRAACDYVCAADCSQGGVAEVIETFVLGA